MLVAIFTFAARWLPGRRPRMSRRRSETNTLTSCLFSFVFSQGLYALIFLAGTIVARVLY